MKGLFTKQPGFLFLGSIMIFSVYACNHSMNDEDIQRKITADLHANDNYKEVEVAVAGGTVSLTGTCDGDNCAGQVGDIVKVVEGVKAVDNQVTRRETDLTLRSSVQSIISKYVGVQADVASRVVVLRGSIDKEQLQPLMTELEALRPEKIDNQLAVKE